jgi:hypothetical protein
VTLSQIHLPYEINKRISSRLRILTSKNACIIPAAVLLRISPTHSPFPVRLHTDTVHHTTTTEVYTRIRIGTCDPDPRIESHSTPPRPRRRHAGYDTRVAPPLGWVEVKWRLHGVGAGAKRKKMAGCRTMTRHEVSGNGNAGERKERKMAWESEGMMGAHAG